MAVITHINTAHTRTIKPDIREITRRLNGSLGGTLIASLAGSKGAKLPYRWAKADGPAPKNEAMRRLQLAYEQRTKLVEAGGEHVARAWFIGANPWLGYDTPIMAIREDGSKTQAWPLKPSSTTPSLLDDGLFSPGLEFVGGPAPSNYRIAVSSFGALSRTRWRLCSR
jgi:hypothetical protein